MDARKAHHVTRTVASGIVAVAECYVLAEILRGVTTPGGPRLYELAWERVERSWARLEYRAQVLSTLRMIRRLPDE